MGNFLYVLSILLIIGWAVGYFVFDAGNIIHGLLILALIAIILSIIRGRKVI